MGFLVSEEGLRADIREALKAAGDPARALSRACALNGVVRVILPGLRAR